MTLSFLPFRLSGSVTVPPSKSLLHRHLLCAALADGVSVLSPAVLSGDILATLACLRALSVDITAENGTITVRGHGLAALRPIAPLPCGDSASTLRFLLPLCLLCQKEARLIGSEALLSRPLTVYEALSREKGFSLLRDGQEIRVQGSLPGGRYSLPGNVSSQFVSGLLMALPYTDAGGVITLTDGVESRPYINMTLSVMEQMGVNACWMDSRTLAVPGGSSYSPRRISVEGDASSAAFWAMMNALDGGITIRNEPRTDRQGDRIYRSLFPLVREGMPTVSVRDCPDLAPVLTVLGALCHGVILTDTRRLRFKESDRGRVMAEELAKCGGSVLTEENRIIVRAAPLCAPACPLSSHGDHRIAMALALLLTRIGGVLEGADAVEKSYPGFFDDLSRLGGRFTSLT